MTESVPQWSVNDARATLDAAIKRAGDMGVRFDDDVSDILRDYVMASNRAAAMIDICSEQRRIVNAESVIVQAREQIDYLKTKLQ